MSGSPPSAYELRKYLDKHTLRSDQMLTLASSAMSAGLATNRHWEWLNVLLTRAFSPDAEKPGAPQAPTEAAVIESVSQLITRPRYVDYLEKEKLLSKSGLLLSQLKRTDTFDELVKNQLPIKRGLHSVFHQNSGSPELLTRNVQLNVEMHAKFERLYGEVLTRMRDLTEQLKLQKIDLRTIPQDSSEVSIWAALEFAAKPEPWVNGEYANNFANLQSVIRMRDLLQRAVVFYGLSLPTLDPTASAVLIDPDHPVKTAASGAVQSFKQQLAYELETEISACVQYLKQTAAGSEDGTAVRVIRLSNGSLVLASWEAAAFSNTAPPSWKVSFLARESREVLQKSIALLAVVEQRRPKPTDNPKPTPGQREATGYLLKRITQSLADFDRLLGRPATNVEDVEILSNLRHTRRKFAVVEAQIKQTLGI